MLQQQTLPPLAHVKLRVSGVVPAPAAEVWKIVRAFGTASEWMAPVAMERISSSLLVRCCLSPSAYDGSDRRLRR
jgi:hypothetical protein